MTSNRCSSTSHSSIRGTPGGNLCATGQRNTTEDMLPPAAQATRSRNILDGVRMSAKPDRPRVLNVVTSQLTVGPMLHHLQYLRHRGFDVAVISPAGRQLDEVARIEGVQAIAVPMARQVSPLR